MISFRYHIVSIIAVFLAIAVGVVVGTTALNGAVVGDLRRQVSDLKASSATTTDQNKKLQAQAGNADLLAQTFTRRIAAYQLTKRKVVIVGAPGATTEMKAAIAGQIASAGGTVSGQLQLTKAFVDPTRANDIRSLATSGVHPINLRLPTTDDAGTLAGALLGFVLLGHGKSTDVTQVLAGFSTLKLADTVGPTITSGQAIVLVAPGSMAAGSPAGAMLQTFSTELGSSLGGPVVVAGDAASDTAGGLIALIRNDDAAAKSVSTVDDATSPLGQLTVSLALVDEIAGRNGQYGMGAKVDALLPGVSG